MRISDWSSDVCSSDLLGRADRAQPFEEMVAHPVGHEARGERQAQHAALLVEPVVLERAQPALKGAAAELVAQPRAYLRPDLLGRFQTVHIAPGRKSNFLPWSLSGFILIQRRDWPARKKA